jgi:hypothetical protein
MSRKQWFEAALAVLVGVALAASAHAYAKRDKAAKGVAAAPVATVTLPDAAAKAVKDAFSGATTGLVKMESHGGMALYAVVLWEGMNDKTALVSADGTIAEVRTPTPIADIADAAAKAIRGADEGALVSKVEKVEVRAEVKDDGGTAKLVKCQTPGTAYDGTLSKTYQTGRIRVAEDGKVLTPLAWENMPPPPPAKAKGGKGGKGGGGRKNK